MPSTRYQKLMLITITIYGPLVIFMVTINYYNPAYINYLFVPKLTYLFLSAIILIVGRRVLTFYAC